MREVTFISLQKDDVGHESFNHPPGLPLINIAPALRELADTAAVIAQLDLVISVDTAMAHLAGALGKPCWVMLPAYKTDWRWLTDRTDTPWYPGVMRLYRQTEMGNWQPVHGGACT